MDRLIALVALRWKLEIRAMSRAKGALFGFLLMVPGLLLSAVMGSAVAFFGLRYLGDAKPALLLPVVSVVASGLGLFYSLSPLLTGLAFVEVHDVTRLLHFPVSHRTLVLSSFVSNLAQPAVLATLPVTLAGGLGLARGAWTLPLTVTGALLTFLFVLAAAQLVGLLFQGVVRERRWRDVAMSLALGLGFLMSFLPFLLMGREPVLMRFVHFLVRYDLFAASPFAWGLRAAVHGSRGQIAAFGAYALAQGLAVAGVMAASTVLMGRVHRGDLIVSTGDRRGRPSKIFFSGAVGALVEKDVRMGVRDPARRAALIMSLVSPLLVMFLLGRTPATRAGMPVFMLSFLVGISPFGANVFALERRGLGLLMSFPVARWRILVAKNLGALALRLPGVAVLVGIAALLAPLHLLPSAVTVVLLTMMLATGVDNYVAILFPLPAPPPGGDPYASVSGSRGLGAAMIGMLALALVLVMTVPFAFLAWLPLILGMRPLALVALPLALLGAAAVYAILVLGAERLLVSREPELLERVLEGP